MSHGVVPNTIWNDSTSKLCFFVMTFTSTYRTSAYPGHICKGCQGCYQGLDKEQHEEYGNPFVDTSKLQAFLKDPLLKQLENYSSWVETSHKQWWDC
jgi:hypothetical protein